MFIYVAFYAISIGPLWLAHYFEVFPQKVRGLGSSLGSVIGLFQYSGNFTFFKIVKAFTVEGTGNLFGRRKLGESGRCFLVYAIVALAAIMDISMFPKPKA